MNESLASPWCLPVVALAGLVAGRMLTRAVSAWFRATGEPLPEETLLPRSIEAVAAAAAVAVWWWEVWLRGQLSPGVDTGQVSTLSLGIRAAGHLLLFWFLAAASWVDMRQRLIPDWITVPGALLGLLWAWAWPDGLLPVVVEVPRSFAGPLLEADVLGPFGGLHARPGIWPAFPLAGLLISLAAFACWWTVCTAPFFETQGRRTWLEEPRNMILVVGLLAIGTAFMAGGDRLLGLQAALIGMLVSGGIVWATRAGASRALGREAMGLGDVTLMSMIGAWLGWQACVLTFFLAAFIGLVHGLYQLARNRESELPFGPSLCLAAVLVVIGWLPLWRLAGVHFGEPAQLAAVVAAVVILTAITLFLWRMVRDRVFAD